MQREFSFDSEAALAQALAADIAARLTAAIQARGHASLAVSGGRSPVPFFEALQTQDLDWSRVWLTLVDERCVPAGHADSNARLVRAHLLQGPAARARFVPWCEPWPALAADDPAAPEALLAVARDNLATLPWPLDVAVLGMGLDGHTASLFPGAPGFEAALRDVTRCARVQPETAPHARLSLTLPGLLSARHLALQIAGPAKRAVYARAAQARNTALPISLLLNQTDTPLQVWIGA